MARTELTRRLLALEGDASQRFTGYAVLWIREGETLEAAMADWIAANGPADDRQWVIFNAGGQNAAA